MTRGSAASLAIVAGVVALAWAASGTPALIARPSIVVVASTPGSGSLQLSTTSTTAISVTAIVADPASCDPGVTVHAPTAFTVSSATPHAVEIDCASGALGLARCLFHVQSGTVDVVDFVGACQRATSTQLTAAPTMLAFGDVPVGSTSAPQTFSLSGGPNLTTLQLQADADLDNAFRIGIPCNSATSGCDAPNTSANGETISVTCRPTSVGTITSHLYAIGAGNALATPVTLTCNGTPTTGPVITAMPSPLAFGTIEVTGGVTATRQLHVANAGTGTLTIGSIEITGAGADWSYTLGAPCTALPCALAAGSGADVAVTFDPSAIGTRNATLQLDSDDVATSQLAVALVGGGAGATLELGLTDPPAIDLGDVPRTASATLPLHLINRGNRDLADVTLAITGAAQLTISPSGTNVSVPAGGMTTVMVSCAPGGASGTFTGAIAASAPDTVNNQPIAVDVTCRGTAAALVATPPAIQLGQIRTGSTVMPVTIALDNTGTAPLTLQGNPAIVPAVPALALSTPASSTIAAGSSEPVKLAVSTTADGDLASAITASDDVDSGYLLQVPITGRVVTAADSVPAAVQLGTFCVNQPTTAATIALTATGTAVITLPTAPAMALAASSPFVLAPRSPPLYPAQLAPADSATVDVAPRPRASSGMANDAVRWATDIVGDHPQTAVTATFLDSGAAIAPATLDFGPIAVHSQAHDARSVTIQNCSASPILLSAAIDPVSEFSYQAAELPAKLLPAQTATFGVMFHPTRLGNALGRLVVTPTPAQPSPLVVALTGMGVVSGSGGDAGTGPNGKSGTSFYACSCTGGGAGGWPIALAALVVIFRRRGSSSAR